MVSWWPKRKAPLLHRALGESTLQQEDSKLTLEDLATKARVRKRDTFQRNALHVAVRTYMLAMIDYFSSSTLCSNDGSFFSIFCSDSSYGGNCLYWILIPMDSVSINRLSRRCKRWWKCIPKLWKNAIRWDACRCTRPAPTMCRWT